MRTGSLGRFAKKVGNGALIVGTLGTTKVVLMAANANERNLQFCGHRLEFHEKDSHGQSIR